MGPFPWHAGSYGKDNRGCRTCFWRIFSDFEQIRDTLNFYKSSYSEDDSLVN